MYSKDETLWLAQYELFDLSAEDKAIMLIGRRGDMIAPNDIIKRLGIVDIEHYRKLIESLQRKKILVNTMPKSEVQRLQKKDGLAARDIARFKILTTAEISQKASSRIAPSFKKSKTDHDSEQGKPFADSKNDKTREKSFDDATVYVANVPPNTTPRDLVFAFREVGAVNSARVPQLNGLSRGYAFIEFESVEVARKALVSATTLGGRKLTLRWATPKASPASRG
jgi:ATP-dependent DNA helicase RecG